MSILRKCIVGNKTEAYFHRWSDKSQFIEPSPFVGGTGGGIINGTVAIVEFCEDGTIHECYPHEIRFVTDIHPARPPKEKTINNKKECIIYNRELFDTGLSSKSYIEDKLINAGFDLTRPIHPNDIERDFKNDCVIYRQEGDNQDGR